MFERLWRILLSVHRRIGLKYRVDRGLRYIRTFGLRGAVRTYRAIWTPVESQLALTVPGLPHPLLLRSGTADASTFEKIFVWKEYDLDYPFPVRTIIDAGANVGFSAVYFATRFPEARIIAIEPQNANFELMRQNTAPYPNVVPVEAALWSSDTRLSLSNPDDRVDSYQYSDGATAWQPVQAYAIPSIIDRFDISSIDILKIDIEGAERQVFAPACSWISSVRMFVVELHGPDATEAFRSATSSLDAVRYRRGESEIVLTRSQTS